MPQIDKIVITNRGALRAKYGSRAPDIDAALAALVSSDRLRGLTTRVVSLDDVAALRRLGASPVSNTDDKRGAKLAIDAIARGYKPDYLMILGARDVVPHQTLRNPMPDDDDPNIPSDLPYACDAAWTNDPRKLLAPTRVVGRLPDVTGASDPGYLVGLLRRAARARMRPRAQYERYLGISALPWRASTDLSLRNVFGSASDLRTSPKQGPRWARTLLERRIHFINCHGSPADPYFYGQVPNREIYPRAHAASVVGGPRAISEGTVVAAECCYGADLYDPAEARGQMGICNVYLASGCYGFFGSTATAYGPEDGNGQADLICQYFLERVLRGASLGRAALEARLRFVEAASTADPTDLKTLAEFLLLGDPSVQPVERAAHAMKASRSFHLALGDAKGRRIDRTSRRVWVLRNGAMLQGTIAYATHAGRFRGSPSVRKLLLRAAREAGVHAPQLRSHRVRDPLGSKIWRDVGAGAGTTFVHTAIGHPPRPRAIRGEPGRKEHSRPVAIILAVRDGTVLSIRRLRAR